MTPETKVPEVLQEILGMKQNLAAVLTCLDVVNRAHLLGSEAQRISQALYWLQGMQAGLEGRLKELQAQLPPEPPQPKPQPAISVAPAVEVQAGEKIEVGVA